MGGTLRLALVLAVLAVTALPALVPRPAFACSCIAEQPLQTDFESARAVFAGRVTRIEREPNTGSGLAVWLDVSHMWKGDAKPEIVVATPSQGSACGYAFDHGADYVVYAHEGEGPLNVNSCGRTHPGGPTAGELAVFGPGQLVADPDAPPDDSPLLPMQSEDSTSTSSAPSAVWIVVGVAILVLGAAVVWWRTARR